MSMFFTNGGGKYLRPYVPWKGPGDTTKAAVPGYSRPMTNKVSYDATTNPNPAPRFTTRPNPIKHWRKQLRPVDVNGISRAAYTVQSDIPGANAPLGTDVECCDGPDGVKQTVWQYVSPSPVYQEGTWVDGPNGPNTVCIACNPETNIIRSGMTEKRINPQQIENVTTFKQYSFSTKQYLQSKCRTYEQNLSGALKDGVKYSEAHGCCVVPTPYNNDINGPQTRLALNCPDETCAGKPINIIVKPNNQQFFQQGAVSSSSRIARLKYNTVQSNAVSFTTAYGAQAANAGRYRADGDSPYFIKSYDQKTCNPVTYFRQGNHTACWTTLTGDIAQEPEYLMG